MANLTSRLLTKAGQKTPVKKNPHANPELSAMLAESNQDMDEDDARTTRIPLNDLGARERTPYALIIAAAMQKKSFAGATTKPCRPHIRGGAGSLTGSDNESEFLFTSTNPFRRRDRGRNDSRDLPDCRHDQDRDDDAERRQRAYSAGRSAAPSMAHKK